MRAACLTTIFLFAFLMMPFPSALSANEVQDTGVSGLDNYGKVTSFNQHRMEWDSQRGHAGVNRPGESSLKPGHALPVLDIEAGGEISVSQNRIVKQPWSSKSLESSGKIQVVQYVAASRHAVRQNKPFTEALIEKQIPPEKLDATVIVHMADTLAIAKGYVAKKLVRSKMKRQEVNFVIDDDGVGLKRWGMKHQSFAVIVLDASGKVLFAKDGPLSENEIEYALELIENQII